VRRAGGELLNALRLLGLSPPAELVGAAPATLLSWATASWRELPRPLARELVLPHADS
jgi:hypothetical protein